MSLPVVLRRYAPLWIAAALLAAAQLQQWTDDTPPPETEANAVPLEGVVLPGVSVKRERLSFHVRRSSEEPQECLRLRVDVHSTVFDLRHFFTPPLRPGDRISLRGELLPVRYYAVPGVGDARRAAADRGCVHFLRLKSPLQLTRLQPVWWGRLLAPLFRYGESFGAALDSILDESPRSVCLAMFLGRRELLVATDRERARELGLWHLYVVSGFHVGVVAGLAHPAAVRLGRAGLPLVAAIAWLYAVLTGLAVSTIRAAAALCLLLAFESVGVRVRAANRLGNVVAFLALLDPGCLRSPGVHFTIACLWGLLLGAPLARAWQAAVRNGTHTLYQTPLRLGRRTAERMSRSLRFRLESVLPDTAASRRTASVGGTLLSGTGALFVFSVFAVAAVAPMTLHYGNIIAPSAALTNLVALPLASALIAVLAGSFLIYWTPLGPVAIQTAGTIARVFETVVEELADLFPPIYEPHPHWGQLVVYWGLLGCVASAARHRIEWIALLPVLPLLLLPLPFNPPDGRLQLTMLDVGQGEAIHLRYPDGSHALVDSGGLPGPDDVGFVGRRLVGRYLWHQRVRVLSDAVQTHPDADHSRGFEFLAGAMPIRRFIVGPDPGSAAPATLAGRLVRVRAGDTWSRASVLHHVLSPKLGSETEGTNDGSIVLRLQFGAFSALLTGDITSRIESRLRTGPVTVLKVAHHGSRTSTSQDFLRAARPKTALISAGRRNLFGHPSPDVVRRLAASEAAVFVTADHGTIRVTTDGWSWHVEHYDGWAARWERVGP